MKGGMRGAVPRTQSAPSPVYDWEQMCESMVLTLPILGDPNLPGLAVRISGCTHSARAGGDR